MKTPDSNNIAGKAQRKRDIPHLIKWIILIVLLILLFTELYSGEYKRIYEQGNGLVWLVLLIKLLLIFGIIILMRVQRSLRCAILTPNGCTEEIPDTAAGILSVKVTGTATGAAFGYYTVEIQKDGDPPQPASLVSYPGGGPNGTSPVLNGELATINTTALSDGAYTITLRVFPIGSGPSSVCTKTFNLLKVFVWINSVGGIAPQPNIFDENAKLESGGAELSFGGSVSLLGSAYVYECDDKKMARVEMRFAELLTPGTEPVQPTSGTAIPADWPATNQLLSPLVYDPSKYAPWTRIGPAPTNLLNTWGTCTAFGTTYPSLAGHNWQSRNATGGVTDGGKHLKLLLATEDTSGATYYDTQKVWIDNHRVRAEIVKFQRLENGSWKDIPNCTDILMSWGKLRIIGIAWDALIDNAYLPTDGPNDNFSSYSLSYEKQFVAGAVGIHSSTSRVPSPPAYPLTNPAPTAADADLLAEWDLSTLDAGPKPVGVKDCPNPAATPHGLHRGCECTYIIRLGVSDKTLSDEYGVHNPSDAEAVKIINDL